VYPIPINTANVEKVIQAEKPDSIMLGFGGQTALNCGVSLHEQGILEKYGIRVLGTQIKGIEVTEDRRLFKEAMIKSAVPVLKSFAVNSLQEALDSAEEIGYPVIIRVAYTLGGRGGGVAHNEYELQEIVQRGLNLSMVHQVLIERYVGHWKQIEYEVMRDTMVTVLLYAIWKTYFQCAYTQVITSSSLLRRRSITLNTICCVRLQSVLPATVELWENAIFNLGLIHYLSSILRLR